MDWITKHIAIGNFLDARKSKTQVDAMLCLLDSCCNPADRHVDVECIPMVDGAGNEDHKIREALSFINDIVSAGDRILVHCHAGRSRSVVIVAKYLMKYRRHTRSDALLKISEAREIYLSPGVEDILDRNI